MARTQVSKIADSGNVVETPATAFSVATLAKFLDVSESWLNSTRAADTKRLARGEGLVGPSWVLIGSSFIRYLRTDVEAWLARTARPGGVAESQRRERRTT
jgi:hypothetical protein